MKIYILSPAIYSLVYQNCKQPSDIDRKLKVNSKFKIFYQEVQWKAQEIQKVQDIISKEP